MRRGTRALLLFGIAAGLEFCSATTRGRTDSGPSAFFVAPNGSASGDGSSAHPWDLATALAQPAAVRPGDTIWLRGGIYAGHFTSTLTGTAELPIVVRQAVGERATLDGGDSGGKAILTVAGAFTWFWGFEVTSSDPKRQSTEAGSWPADIPRGDGVDSGATPSSGVRLINLVIHDTRQGVSAFVTWQDAEINGCLIYYNGWNGTDNGHGHGIYTQNQTGDKRIVDNVLFHQFSHGLHAYGSEKSFLNNYDIEGNTIFSNGDLTNKAGGRDVLLGGGVVLNNATIVGNAIYSTTGPGSDFYLGYTTGCSNTTMKDNYTASGTLFGNCAPVTMTGNTFYGYTNGFARSQYPDNTYLSTRPTSDQVLIRPNQYESGRANITVFNWTLQPSVAVDLSGVLATGAEYEVRNVQDFFGPPVVQGVYDGSPVALPMADLTVAAPVGWPAPAPTGPEFNTFVVLTKAAARDEPVRPAGTTPPPARAVRRPAKESSVSP